MVRRHEMVLNFRLYVPIGTMLSEIVRIELRKCRNGSKKTEEFLSIRSNWNHGSNFVRIELRKWQHENGHFAEKVNF